MPVVPDADKSLKIAIASHYSQLAFDKWQELAGDQSFNLPALASLSNARGLSPLLYHRLKETPDLPIPAEIEHDLIQSYHTTASFNLLALHELSIVLGSLAHHGIAVVVLKGAGLLLSVYDNYALRPMVDLDLLVQFDDLEKTTGALASAGYLEPRPIPFANYQGLFWNEILLVSSGMSKMQVELHWHLLDNPYYARKLRTETLIARSRKRDIAGERILLLAPEDQIIHLCIHNTYHHRSLFQRSFVDIAFVANHYSDEIDWDFLVRTALDSDMAYAVAKNLSVAKAEWFAPIPAEIISRLEKTGLDIRERFFILSQQSEFLKLGRTLATVPGLKPKILYILGQLLPSREYLLWRYGRGKTEPIIILYLKRYISGLIGLILELTGRSSRLRRKEAN